MGKNLDKWLLSYVRQEIGRCFVKKGSQKATHIMFGCMDHYEPGWNNADEQTQIKRIENWIKKYPLIADQHRDADGHCPKHTFFYPAEVYNKKHLELLKRLCKKGYGEVEVHLHHDNDTEESLKKKLLKAKKDFTSHGLLGRRILSGQPHFAFIHGNWALNNSRKDGRWCGVNDEAKILKDVGCYADFTYPSAPSETQTSKINSIYYTKSNQSKPKAHNKGIDVRVGSCANGDLMLIQGPLALNFKNRKKGVFPGIENGDITAANPPSQDRINLWVNQRISVKGKEEWIFIKVYTHGAQEQNATVLLGESMHQMFQALEKKYNDGKRFVLHYTSAREMYNIVKAAEAGEKGNPNDYRDYIIEKGKGL